MSDSESPLPDAFPANDDIEQCLIWTVRDQKKSDADPPSVNQIRAITAEKLGLGSDFFKHVAWKARSKDIITEAFNADDEAIPSNTERTASLPDAQSTANTPHKRKAGEHQLPEAQPLKKARNTKSKSHKVSWSEAEESDDLERPRRQLGNQRVGNSASAKSRKRGEIDLERNEDDDLQQEDGNTVAKSDEVARRHLLKGNNTLPDRSDTLNVQTINTSGTTAALEDDESDLSSLIDDVPPKKKRGKKMSSETKPTTRTATVDRKSTKEKPAGQQLSGDEEEIKRLQGWLLKCGIRKLWHKELASCSTPKEKIKHLKGMLDSAGMTGRFSAEKARQIKESRELAAEIESAQEFNKKWGEDGDEDDEDMDDGGDGDHTPRKHNNRSTQRRLPKGFVDFGDSGDEASD